MQSKNSWNPVIDCLRDSVGFHSYNIMYQFTHRCNCFYLWLQFTRSPHLWTWMLVNLSFKRLVMALKMRIFLYFNRKLVKNITCHGKQIARVRFVNCATTLICTLSILILFPCRRLQSSRKKKSTAKSAFKSEVKVALFGSTFLFFFLKRRHWASL